MDLSALIAALGEPTAYPEPVEKVRVVQTHISVVFLAGEFAYKIKKPVDYDFLDFSTLDKRHHFCEEEVRLNRRLAADVYLGVVPVVAVGAALRFEGTGDAVEWAVKMRRLPEEATFYERLLRDDLPIGLAEELGRRVASFHRAPAAPPPASFGRFEAVSRNLRDIYEQSQSQVGATVSVGVFERARALNETALAAHRAKIDERAERGGTRDTHGDMHLDHVYYFPEKTPPADLAIIDCIEFTERFRYTDPVADMAFPHMDFLYHGRRDLAAAYREAYFQATGDAEGRVLLSLYTAYRASVRGSVDGMKAAGKEVEPSERAAALRSARAHWLLTLVELEEPSRRPCLVMVGGLAGSGKSTLARGLAEFGGFEWIRSDTVRKELAGLPPTEPAPEDRRAELYSSEMTERTYAECLRRAGERLFEGRRVVVDATFREEARRVAFLRAAIDWGVPAALLIVSIADEETIRRRLAGRTGDPSDADWSINRDQKWEPAGETVQRIARPIFNEGTPEEVLSMARSELQRFDPPLL